MVKNEIVINSDIDACKALYEQLGSIIRAYEAFPILEEIHRKSGNRLMNTGSNRGFREQLIADAFNEEIIRYVSGPAKESDDDDDCF